MLTLCYSKNDDDDDDIDDDDVGAILQSKVNGSRSVFLVYYNAVYFFKQLIKRINRQTKPTKAYTPKKM